MIENRNSFAISGSIYKEREIIIYKENANNNR